MKSSEVQIMGRNAAGTPRYVKLDADDQMLVGGMGATGDAAVVTDTSGTVNGFLRGLVKMISNMWDSVNGAQKVIEQKIPYYENDVALVAQSLETPPAGDYSTFGWDQKAGFTGTTYQTVKATPGLVRKVYVTNSNAAVRYLLTYNQASATPSGSTNLVLAAIPIPPGAGVTIPAVIVDVPFYPGATGITLAVSTANNTFTAATAAEHSLMTYYK